MLLPRRRWRRPLHGSDVHRLGEAERTEGQSLGRCREGDEFIGHDELNRALQGKADQGLLHLVHWRRDDLGQGCLGRRPALCRQRRRSLGPAPGQHEPGLDGEGVAIGRGKGLRRSRCLEAHRRRPPLVRGGEDGDGHLAGRKPAIDGRHRGTNRLRPEIDLHLIDRWSCRRFGRVAGRARPRGFRGLG